MQNQTKSLKLIKAILVDPFKQGIFSVHLRPDSAPDVAGLLDCRYIEAVKLLIAGQPVQIIWIDEEGLLRQPFVYPQFRCQGANGGNPLAGYGLITGISPTGTMENVASFSFAPLLFFEEWEKRIPTDSVISQLLRIYLPNASDS
jgi:peptidoglycan hydrolase-like protein with peptidoglycan-binding domain